MDARREVGVGGHIGLPGGHDGIRVFAEDGEVKRYRCLPDHADRSFEIAIEIDCDRLFAIELGLSHAQMGANNLCNNGGAIAQNLWRSPLAAQVAERIQDLHPVAKRRLATELLS